MTEPKIQPEKITKPIQLIAVWFAALVLLVGTFLTAAATISSPTWVAPMLAAAAVIFVLLFLFLAFVMLTKYRTHLQADPYYSKWQERQDKLFLEFQAENVETTKETVLAPSDESYKEREIRRIKRYESLEGLFVIHSWRPSNKPRQVADIVIWLHQHGDGPLSQGLVDKVEWHLGPKFFTHRVVKTNARDKFKLEVSAYGPMLCLARAFVKGRKEPIDLEHYIDFEEAP